MRLLGMAAGVKVTLKFMIEDRDPDGFRLCIVGDAESSVRIGTWPTLQKAQDVAARIARQTVMAESISWREPDRALARKSWKDALATDWATRFTGRALRSSRPCPACGGFMRYIATITTFITKRRLRMCIRCGHSDPKPVWVSSA